MAKSTTAGKLCIGEKKQIERVGLVMKSVGEQLLGDFPLRILGRITMIF